MGKAERIVNYRQRRKCQHDLARLKRPRSYGTDQVPCMNASNQRVRHTIVHLPDGRVRLLDHPDWKAELALLALGNLPATGCLLDLETLRTRGRARTFMVSTSMWGEVKPNKPSGRYESELRTLRSNARTHDAAQAARNLALPTHTRLSAKVERCLTVALALLPEPLGISIATEPNLMQVEIVSTNGLPVERAETWPNLLPAGTHIMHVHAGAPLLVTLPTRWLTRVWARGFAVVGGALVLDASPVGPDGRIGATFAYVERTHAGLPAPTIDAGYLVSQAGTWALQPTRTVVRTAWDAQAGILRAIGA